MGGGQVLDRLAGNLTATVLSTEGPATLVQTAGAILLFDTGAESDASREHVVSQLQKRGVSSLDFLVLSNTSPDRAGGCEAILQTFQVKRVVHPGLNSTDATWQGCLHAIATKGVPILSTPTLRPGQILRVDDFASIEILGLDPTASTIEDGSLAVRLTYGAFAMVLVGDGSCSAEQRILDSGANPRADMLELPLHGSDHGACDPWLSAVAPRMAFTSPGPTGPGSETLRRLARHGVELLRAGPDGTITIHSDGAGFQVQPDG